MTCGSVQYTLDDWMVPRPRDAPCLPIAMSDSRLHGASSTARYAHALRARLFESIPVPATTYVEGGCSLVRIDPDGRVLTALSSSVPKITLWLRGVAIYETGLPGAVAYHTAQWGEQGAWGRIALGARSGVVVHDVDGGETVAVFGVKATECNSVVSEVAWAGASTVIIALRNGQWATWDLRAPPTLRLQSSGKAGSIDFALRASPTADSPVCGMGHSPGPLVHLANTAGYVHTWDLRSPCALVTSMAVASGLGLDTVGLAAMCTSTLRPDCVIVHTTSGVLAECCLATKSVLSAWEHPSHPPTLGAHPGLYSVDGGALLADAPLTRLMFYDVKGVVHQRAMRRGARCVSVHVVRASFPCVAYALAGREGGVEMTTLWGRDVDNEEEEE